MTDNKIIKALECCNKSDNGKGCFECPYRQYCPDCLRRRNEDTIDLINRQKAEIEALIAGQETLQKNLAKSLKVEAYNEMADRVKNTFYSNNIWDMLFRKTIDLILKTMISEVERELVGEAND